MRLVWSSRSQKFTGHAMTHKELSILCDVYQTLSPDFRQKQTSYVLQTLWQDLTSAVCWLTNMYLQLDENTLILIADNYYYRIAGNFGEH